MRSEDGANIPQFDICAVTSTGQLRGAAGSLDPLAVGVLIVSAFDPAMTVDTKAPDEWLA